MNSRSSPVQGRFSLPGKIDLSDGSSPRQLEIFLGMLSKTYGVNGPRLEPANSQILIFDIADWGA